MENAVEVKDELSTLLSISDALKVSDAKAGDDSFAVIETASRLLEPFLQGDSEREKYRKWTKQDLWGLELSSLLLEYVQRQSKFRRESYAGTDGRSKRASRLPSYFNRWSNLKHYKPSTLSAKSHSNEAVTYLNSERQIQSKLGSWKNKDHERHIAPLPAKREKSKSEPSFFENWSKLNFLNYFSSNKPKKTSKPRQRRPHKKSGKLPPAKPFENERKRKLPVADEESSDDEDKPDPIIIKIVPVYGQYRAIPPQLPIDSRLGKDSRLQSRQGAEDRMDYLEERQSGLGVAAGAGASGTLAAAIPLLLILGLALGFAAQGFSNGSGSVNSTTIININGSSITNTFTPTNTATATNTNDDMDTITVTNTNMGRRRKRGAGDDEGISRFWGNETVYEMLGVAPGELSSALSRSQEQIVPAEILWEVSALTRKFSCLMAKSKGICFQRVICEQFGENHLIYDGNLLLRAAEVSSVSLLGLTAGYTADEFIELMNDAVTDMCRSKYRKCDTDTVRECYDIA